MPTILMNITMGFQARQLLRSSVSDTLLREGARLVVVSPNANEKYFQDELAHRSITLEQMPRKDSRIENNAVVLRQYLLMNPSLGGTLNQKREAFKQEQPIKAAFCRGANIVLGRIRFLRNAYMTAEAWMYPGDEWDALLQKHRPDLIVTGTPGFNIHDAHLLRAARRLGIPSATVMLSWDNLTSKGYMNGVPDHLLVWSDLMAEEAERYHDYPRACCHWVGAPQFDHYFGFRERFDRAAWRAARGIAEDAKLFVYGTINPRLVPHEPQIVRQIVEAMRSGKFGPNVHLWIRLHPQVIKGIYANSLRPYRDLAGVDVTVEEPPVRDGNLPWDLPRSDAEHLASLLTAADVVLTPGSTLVIDAACVGTPSINIFFDGPHPVETGLQTRRFASYTHYGQILATGVLPCAYSLDECVGHANEVLSSPRESSARLRLVIAQQLGVLDGRAGERTGLQLLRLAGAEARTEAAAPIAPQLA